MQFNAPLRYPGGKARLSQYVIDLMKLNNLVGGHYVEPYAGGAAIGLTLLYLEYANHIHLNDLNRAVFAFWHSVLNETEELCRRIKDRPITLDERKKQKSIQLDKSSSGVDLGFSTFFLNRTNRSGIISGGVIGGNNQIGEWKIDARYKKDDLIDRIQKISAYRSRITLTNLDAEIYINDILPNLPDKTLVYLDPPYYTKGKKLYQNHYKHGDHAGIARSVASIRQKWIVSYDNTKEITDLYSAYEQEHFSLVWSARSRYEGAEIMIFGPNTTRPNQVVTWRGIAA
ncbi:DNA adenine methylase [Roseococcus sp.]|uniref:DNA adenine methylase n=1 Tax=Roseococcus sp. TaxID=2109646 RepID=UPI003BA8F185